MFHILKYNKNKKLWVSDMNVLFDDEDVCGQTSLNAKIITLDEITQKKQTLQPLYIKINK